MASCRSQVWKTTCIVGQAGLTQGTAHHGGPIRGIFRGLRHALWVKRQDDFLCCRPEDSAIPQSLLGISKRSWQKKKKKKNRSWLFTSMAHNRHLKSGTHGKLNYRYQGRLNSIVLRFKSWLCLQGKSPILPSLGFLIYKMG